MTLHALIVFLACVIAPFDAALAFDAGGSRTMPAQGTMQVAFTPWDDVESIIVDAIDGAGSEVLLQAYIVTNIRIAGALITAFRRGIDVRVLADAEQSSNNRTSQVHFLAAAGIPVWLETRYQSAHNKVVVIDAASLHPVVITGSFNFTWSAQHRNAENILVARSNPPLAARYAANWERHRQDATIYKK